MANLSPAQKERIQAIRQAYNHPQTGVKESRKALQRMVFIAAHEEEINMATPGATMVAYRNKIVASLTALAEEIAAI